MYLESIKRFLFVYFLACCCDSHAQELIQVGSETNYIALGQVVKQSSLIAKVRIMSVMTVSNNEKGDDRPCGFVYQAKVMHALKGRHEVNVQFFVLLEAYPYKLGREYLVFLNNRSAQKAKEIDASLKQALTYGELEKLMCKLQEGYYVPSGLVPLPFDADAARQFGGEWLDLQSGRGMVSQILLCEVKEMGAGVADSKSHRRKKSGGAVVSWAEMVRLIKKANGVFSFLNTDLDACG